MWKIHEGCERKLWALTETEFCAIRHSPGNFTPTGSLQKAKLKLPSCTAHLAAKDLQPPRRCLSKPEASHTSELRSRQIERHLGTQALTMTDKRSVRPQAQKSLRVHMFANTGTNTYKDTGRHTNTHTHTRRHT